MKRPLLIVIFLITSILSKAQEKEIEGFLGIKFGSTKAQVQRAMTARGSALIVAESNADSQKYKNVKLGNRTVNVFYVQYVNDKAYQASFYFIPKLEAKIVEDYDSIVEDVSEVYGKGESYKNFKYPYEDGDGHELTAIKVGKADYKTYWIKQNAITAEILSTAMAIRLKYQDSKLIDLVIEKQKQSLKSDF